MSLELHEAAARGVPGDVDIHVVVSPAICIVAGERVLRPGVAEARAGPFPGLGPMSPSVPTLRGGPRHAYRGARPTQPIGSVRVHSHGAKSCAAEVGCGEGLAGQAQVCKT